MRASQGGKEYTVTRTYNKNLKSLAQFWIGTGAFFPGESRWLQMAAAKSRYGTRREEAMNAKYCAAIAALIFSLTFVGASPGQTQAQDDKDKYPNMAPLDRYMMERDAEIGLARTAAPEYIGTQLF